MQTTVAGEGNPLKTFSRHQMTNLRRVARAHADVLPDVLHLLSHYSDFVVAMQLAPTIDIVFMSVSGAERLIKCGKDRIYIDGTHGVLPGFQLIVILVADEDDHGEAVAYFLTSSKNQESYAYFLSAVDRRCHGQFYPASVMADFEASFLVAIHQEWADAHVFGCLFHFMQALLRNAKKLGIAESDVKTILQQISDLQKNAKNHVEIVEGWKRICTSVELISPEFATYALIPVFFLSVSISHYFFIR